MLHRSFQEYFTARFIANATPPQKAQLVKRFARTGGSDAVIPLLYELDTYTVEQHYILPHIQRLKQAIGFKRTFGMTHYVKCLRVLVTHFALSHSEERQVFAIVSDRMIVNALLFANARYLPRISMETGTRAGQEVKEAFTKEFGSDATIQTSAVTPKSAFVAVIARSPGFWGMKTMKALLALEDLIQKRHQDAQESLDTVLS